MIRVGYGWLLLLAATGCAESGVSIRTVDPLINVLPGVPIPANGDDTIRVARGENAVLQFILTATDSVEGLTPCLRRLKSSCGNTIGDNATFGWIQNVRAAHAYTPAAPDALQSPLGEYPDPILTDTVWNIAPGGTALLWTDIPIPNDAVPGLYEGTLRVHGRKNGRKTGTPTPPI